MTEMVDSDEQYSVAVMTDRCNKARESMRGLIIDLLERQARALMCQADKMPDDEEDTVKINTQNRAAYIHELVRMILNVA